MFVKTELVVVLDPLRIQSTAYVESEWMTMGDLKLMSSIGKPTWDNKKNSVSMTACTSAVLLVLLLVPTCPHTARQWLGCGGHHPAELTVLLR